MLKTSTCSISLPRMATRPLDHSPATHPASEEEKWGRQQHGNAWSKAGSSEVGQRDERWQLATGCREDGVFWKWMGWRARQDGMQDDRNHPLPGPQPLLPGDLQPQHAEEFPAAPSCSKHPPPSSQGSNKPCSPGQLLSSQGSLARLFGRATWGEAKVAAWIRQQNIHALPPPPAPLLFPMGFEA